MSTVPTEVRVAAIGIVLALYPNIDPTLSIEVERAPDDSGSPDTANAETVAVLPPGSQVYVDVIGGPGPYYYRIRHVRPKATASSWTDWVGALPRGIPAQLPSIPPLRIIHQDASTRSMSSALETTLQSVTLAPHLLGLRGSVRITGTFVKSGTADLGACNIYVGGYSMGGYDFAVDDEDEVAFEIIFENVGSATDHRYATRRFRDAGVTYYPGAWQSNGTYGAVIDTDDAVSILFSAQLGLSPSDTISLTKTRVEYLGAS